MGIRNNMMPQKVHNIPFLMKKKIPWTQFCKICVIDPNIRCSPEIEHKLLV